MPSSESGYDELRIALVMTGGVSLAVWMGGIANELNRMLHGDGLYGELLDLLAYKPRVDVITGSSAGGLNGALLATAIANEQDISHIREIWAEEGGLASLMRSPFDRSPTSVLEGDEKFLPALLGAFASLVQKNHPFPKHPLREPDPPLRLTVTTTLLKGEPHVFSDDFGSLISEPDHRGEFHFRRGSQHEHVAGLNDESVARNDFVGDDAAARLARAVRCSASFPGAFEASYSPGRDDGPVGGVNMKDIANFSLGQFTIDGGTLVNKPIGAALEQVYMQPATTPVRRVLAYVNPLPSDVPAPPADASLHAPIPPSLGTVLAKAVVGVRAVESLAKNLEDLQNHNRRVRGLGKSLDALAESAGGEPERLPTLARSLYEAYRRTREQGAVAHILDCVVSKSPENVRGRVYDLRTLEQVLTEAITSAGAPWTPPVWPPEQPLPLGAEGEWRWGIFGVEGIAGTVLTVLGRAQTIERINGPAPSTIGSYRSKVHGSILRAAILREADRQHWERIAGEAFDQLATLSSPATSETDRGRARAALSTWAENGMRSWLAPQPAATAAPDHATAPAKPDPRELLLEAALAIAQALVDASPAILTILEQVSTSARPAVTGEVTAIRATLDMLAPAGVDPRDCLRNLLALEVVEGALRSPFRTVDQAVELLQVSAVTPNALRPTPRPEDKLTGAQLFHFGAFYKRSWRYNDWMWGRLDGAMRMAQLLFDPERFAQVIADRHPERARADHPEIGCDLVRKLAIDDEPNAERRDLLATYWEAERDEVRTELAFLGDPELPPPSSLPRCSRTLARRLQLDVACVEMPMVRKAAEADAVDRDQDLQPLDPQPAYGPAAAVAALQSCDIGKEQILSEVGTNRFLDVTTRAGVVTTSSIQNSAGGIPTAKKLLRPLRGLTLALYWVTAGVTQNTAGTTAAFLGILALSGAVLTVVLASGDYTRLPAIATLLAIAVVIIGAVVWARRIGYQLVTIAILVVVAIGAAVFAFPAFDTETKNDHWRSVLLVTRPFLLGVILVGGLMALGGAGQRVKPLPLTTRKKILRYVTITVVLCDVAVAVGAVFGIVWAVRSIYSIRDDRDAARTVVTLLGPPPTGVIPAADHVIPAAISSDLSAFDGVATRSHNQVAHLDMGVSDANRGVLHAWVFRRSGDAQQFLDGRIKGAEGSPPCGPRAGRVTCWERDGRVVIGSSSPRGVGPARDLLAVGHTIVPHG